MLGFILDALPGISGFYREQISSLLENDPATIMLVAVIAPVLEELFFRFLILFSAKKFFPFYAANIIQAALFGIYHMNPVQGIYAFVLGLFIGYLVKRTGSVTNCICFHIVFNITGLLLDDLMPDNMYILIRLIIMVISLAGFFLTLMKLMKQDELTGQPG